MSGGRDQLRQQIAEAIWRADINTGHRDFIAEFDVSWADDIGAEAKRHYHKLADAAIDAAGDYMAPPW